MTDVNRQNQTNKHVELILFVIKTMIYYSTIGKTGHFH